MRFWQIFVVAIVACWSSVAFAQDDDDRGYIAGLLEDALGAEGRTVRIEGFAGALSSTATIERITIADPDGIWLTVEEVEMTWRRSALLRGAIDIETMTASRIALPRFPLPAPSEAPSAAAPGFALPDLPVSVNIAKLGSDLIEIGAPVLGQDAVFALEANAALADSMLDAALDAQRVDGLRGVFSIELGFEQETESLRIGLNLSEQANGIAASQINLPGLPSLDLSIDGAGPLSEFTAELALKTDGEDRLSGTIGLLEPEGEPGTRRFDADIDGDVAALFLPAYQDFFGPRVALKAIGVQSADGSFDLEKFDLTTKALRLAGTVSLNADSWPVSVDVSGTLGAEDGAPVLLPLSGDPVTLRSAEFSVRHDATVSSEWAGSVVAQAFETAGIQLGRMALTGSGTIDANPGGIGEFAAGLAFDFADIRLDDPDVSAALGRDIEGRAQITFADDEPLTLSDLKVSGRNFDLIGDAVVRGLDSAFETRFAVGFQSPDITFASAFVDQDLAGAVDVNVEGTADAGGAFDVKVVGVGTELRTGIDAADTLLLGRTNLNIDVVRDADGLRLRNAEVQTPEAQASASGRLGETDGDLSFDVALNEVSKLVAAVRGPLSLQGKLSRNQDFWQIEANGQGPYRSDLSVSGALTPALDLNYTFDMPNIAPLVPGFSGPLGLLGELEQSGQTISTTTNVTGPAGTNARVAGNIAPEIELDIAGGAPLGLANPFIRPRSVRGQARFDLRLIGADLTGLSGTVRISDTIFVAPSEGLTFEDISGSVDLARGRATLGLQASPTAGGTMRVEGPIVLMGSNSADLRITLGGVVLEDPSLFRTSINGQISVQGPLQTSARIAGRLDVGETLITIASPSIGSFSSIPDIKHIGAPGAVTQTRRRAGLLKSPDETSGAGPNYPIDLTIAAPSRVFVRGRGLDAELGGGIRLTGTTQQLISAGAIELIRGRLNILGQRFDLSEGRVTLVGDFNPFLRFVASSETSSGTASVILEGRASDPDVRFESSPTLPQEEVVALLIFGRDISSLSAFQALQLANAVATLAGRKGVGLLSRLREGFALDDLDVATDDQGNASVRIGKYITDNVYTDVLVGDSDDAGVSINIDLTPNITARGAATQGSGTSLGIYYEKDY